MRPVRWSRVTNDFAAPGNYASNADAHGRAGHHTGVDFGKHLSPFKEIDGKPVRSVTAGRVMISEHDPTMGHWVGVYNATDDVLITYWHLSQRGVAEGARVTKGAIIGRVGSSGNSTAPHLHVQANRGRTFDYQGHVSPWPWVSGMKWWRKRFGSYGAERRR